MIWYEVECDDKAIPQTFLATVDVTYRSKSKVRFHTQRIKDYHYYHYYYDHH